MDTPALTVDRVYWSAEAAEGLRASLGRDLLAVQHEVENGEAHLWHISGGYAVTRIERDPDGYKTLVIVALQASPYKEIGLLFLRMAKNYGLDRVRWFASRPGAERVWQFLEPRKVATILEVDLNG